MARTSASSAEEGNGGAGGGGTAAPVAAAVGPAAVCAAALAVPLGYVPILNSVFAEPKLALLWVAGSVAIAGWLLVSAQRASTPSPRLSRALGLAVGALLASTLVATLAAWTRGAPGAPYAGLEIGRLLAVVGIALASAQAAIDARWRRRLLTSIQVGAGLVSLIGILQHLQILPLALPVISVPGSTFGNRNIAAEAVAMSIPFGLGWLALSVPGAGEPRRDAPAAILLLLALELIYLGATRTRGAWLGAAGGIAVFHALRRLGPRGRAAPRAVVGFGVAVALGVAALASAVIPGRVIPRDLADAKRFEPGEHVVREALDPTSPVVRTRLGLWRRTLAMYRAHPFLGVGPGNFVVFFPLYAEPGARAEGVLTPSVVPRRAHEDLLERLAETGPLGLAALLAIYGVAVLIAVRRTRRADAVAVADADLGAPSDGDVAPAEGARLRDEAAMGAAAVGSLVALFACGLTGFPLAMPGTSLLFGVALGLLAAESRVKPREMSPALTPARSGGARFRSLAAALVGVAIVLGTTVASARLVTRSYWLARARAALRAGDRPGLGPPAALAALGHAARSDDAGRFEVALETAFVLVRMARFADALAAVDRALAVEPHSATAWALRAEAALGAGMRGAPPPTPGTPRRSSPTIPRRWRRARAPRRASATRAPRARRVSRWPPSRRRATSRRATC